MSFSFPKHERLSSQKLIQKLYEQGHAFVKYPFRIIWLIDNGTEDTTISPRVLITVSKKKFKRANKRAYIRRRTKEAYRLNKQPLIDFAKELKLPIVFSINYLPSELMEYHEIEKGMIKMLDKLRGQIMDLGVEKDSSSSI